MSLILDALRKSEAERRRGNLPALAIELPPPPPSAVPARGWWLAIPVVVVLAAIAFWFARPAAPVQAPTAAQPVRSLPVTTIAKDAAAMDEPAATRPPPMLDAVTADAVMTDPVPAAPEREREPIPASATAHETTETPGTTPAPILALADLTPDERRALPPLKLSMHMWSAVPADRFVILDGDRLGEGDRAGSAVVERIDPDGVILAADGRRIRLPLP